MSITIKISQGVPYTTVTCVAEASMDTIEITRREPGLTLMEIVGTLQRQVLDAVSKELAARQIKLGPDGFKVP